MQNKRKAFTPSFPDLKVNKTAKSSITVNSKRIRPLNDIPPKNGPVIYWMQRDMRVNDNWALLYAMDQAEKTNSPLAVAYSLVDNYLGAGARHYGFMLRGLKMIPEKLNKFNIPFFFTKSSPVLSVSSLVASVGAGLLITDFAPLRIEREWRKQVRDKINCAFHEVDAHNVVPLWVTSDKQEYAAYTIRPKIKRHLDEFLTDFPNLREMKSWSLDTKPAPTDWSALLEEFAPPNTEVPEVHWIKPGEDAAMEALKEFLNSNRIKDYATKRNDPTHPDAMSNLSPYFHFGFLSPQRAAFDATMLLPKNKESVDGFIEQLVIRRELSDNYCYYDMNYDNFNGAADWAKETLIAHSKDKREFVYTREEFEKGKTHDKLWNAAQLEMVHYGKMHTFMRMYWAKKILEWSPSPQEALEWSIYLNDKYELDGRDANGYVGCKWSIMGLHDHGFMERHVFGKVRCMTYSGCKNKFNVDSYIARITKMKKEFNRI